MAVYKDENKTKDGRSWYFKTYKKDFNGNNKAYKSKKYLRKTDAEEAERIFLMKRDNPLHKPFSIIADDYFDNLSKIRKDSTVYSYKKDFNGHIKPFFEKYDILDINVQIIKIWASELEKKGISVSYMNKIHNILNCIFDFGIKNYGLNENPSRVFGTFQEKNDKITLDELKLRYITLNDFNIFINNIHDPLWNTFFNFEFYTGCRKGEIQALTWKDIDLNNNEIIINKTLYEEIKGKVVITSTKNNKNRKIKINKTLNDVLQKYKTYVKQFSDYSESWYVFGNTRFLPKTTIDRYKHNFLLNVD